MTHQEDEVIHALYKEGVISYEQGQELLLKIYLRRGKATKSRIQRSLFTYKYNPGARSAVEYLQKQGYILALISGSIDLVVEKVAKELSVSYYAANNQFVFDKDNKLKNMVTFDDETKAKVEFLKTFCKKERIRLTDCACIGDGSNDVALFKETKHGVTFTDSSIKQYAWKTVDSLADLQRIF